MNTQNTQRILGIDPGYGRVGVGIIEGSRDTWKILHYECIETNPKASFIERLSDIEVQLRAIVQKYVPTHAAVEQLFFSKNTTTALKVSEARGAICLLLHQQGLPIIEIGPGEVKQYITGYGNANKSQVQTMVAMSLGLKNKKIQDDAADALAIALSCGLSMRLRQ